MAVYKSQAEVLTDSGLSLGGGMAYLHLPKGVEREQDAGGTVSLESWTEGEPPAAIRLSDGRRLRIVVSRDALSDCSQNRILRFETHWPPEPGAA